MAGFEGNDEDKGGSAGPRRPSDERVQAEMREIGRKLRKLRKDKATGDRSERRTEMLPDPPKRRETIIVGDLRRRSRREESEPPKPTPKPVAATPPPAKPRVEGPPVLLEEEAPGVEQAAEDGSLAYIITERIADRDPSWRALGDAFREYLKDPADLMARLPQLTEPPRPEDLLFLDLETTGLTSTPLFLIGTMVWEDGGFVVRQYFARHYGEEPATLLLFLADAADKTVLVSFNGKSYDWPYVKMRAAASRVPFTVELAHLDLLHEARRAWKHHLPDCKLQTLEHHICGRELREDDIPGSEIPEAYHDYVRSNNAVQMVTVLEHNYLDLVTLADILVRLPR